MGDIVVGVDGSEGSRHALAWALTEARRRQVGLRMVTAWQPPIAAETQVFALDEEIKRCRRAAEDLVACLVPRDSADVRIEARVVEGDPTAVLLRELDREGDLLVVGSRGRGGFAALRLGSVSEHCARHASAPVVVVPEDATVPDGDGRVVVGIDGSPPARVALAWAFDEAASRYIDLVVVNGWWNPSWIPSTGHAGGSRVPLMLESDSEELLREEVEAVASGTSSRPPHIQLVSSGDPPTTSLLDQVKPSDLLVVGSRGRGGFAALLLGSVSEQCIRHSHGAVAVIRSTATAPGPMVPGPMVPGPMVPGPMVPGPMVPGPMVPGPTASVPAVDISAEGPPR